MAKGMLAFVYRSGVDCTGGGVSSYHDQFVVVGATPVFETGLGAVCLYLCEWMGQTIAVPEKIDTREGLHGWMFGGNFVYTSDSRWPTGLPIKIFDRRES